MHVSTIEALNGLLETVIEFRTYACAVKILTLHIFSSNICDSQENPGFAEEARMRSLPQDFIVQIEKQRAWANALLLLLQLQDLEVLQIETGFNSNVDINIYLSKFFNDNLLSTKLRVFTRDSFNPLSLGTFFHVFLSPSIVEIYGSPVVSDWETTANRYFLSDLEMSLVCGTSTIEKLELHSGGISGEDFHKLMKLPRALKTLIYQGGPSSLWFDSHLLNEFREALEAVAQSLEFFDIKWDDEGCFDDASNLWTFQSFHALKDLYISYSLVYGLNPCTAPCIAESLPPVLEVLVMYPPSGSRWTREEFLSLWRSLLTKKSSRVLNKLRLVAHTFDLKLLQPLNYLANDQNVRIASEWTDLDHRVVSSRLCFQSPSY
jgi:hypothetical protein